MTTITKGLCWAAAMILLAIGNRLGAITDSNATTMFAILPAVAVISISGRQACRFRRSGSEA